MIQEELIHIRHKLKFGLIKKPSRINTLLVRGIEKIIRSTPDEMVIKTLYDFKLKINPGVDKGVERSIYNTGTYEAGTLHAFDLLLKNGDIFFDIGSNIGLMTLYASRKVGRSGQVHSFEPEPGTYKILEENCLINRVENIFLNKIALGSEEMEGVIYPNLDINRGAASLVRQDGTNGSRIWINTLDQYLSNRDIKKIKLIKVDIEGYEIEMLKGALKLLSSENAPILCIEYSKDVKSVGEVSTIYDLLKEVNNYQVYKFTEWKGSVCKLMKVQTKNDLPEHDNIFCFLPHHLQNANPLLFA